MALREEGPWVEQQWEWVKLSRINENEGSSYLRSYVVM